MVPVVGRSRSGGVDDRAGSPAGPGPVQVQCVIRQRGRPKLIEGEGMTLSVWVPTTVYDRLNALADQRKQSISTFTRDVLMLVVGIRPE